MRKGAKNKKVSKKAPPTKNGRRRRAPSSHIPAAAKRFPVEKIDPQLDKIRDPVMRNGVPTAPAQSLLEAVRDLLRYHKRRTFLTTLCEQYGVSRGTVDRAIAEVHKEWDEFHQTDSKRRIGQGVQRYVRLAEKAEEAQQFTAARGALDSAHRLAGDMKPDIVLLGSAELPAEDLQAEALRLAEVAARRSKS